MAELLRLLLDRIETPIGELQLVVDEDRRLLAHERRSGATPARPVA